MTVLLSQGQKVRQEDVEDIQWMAFTVDDVLVHQYQPVGDGTFYRNILHSFPDGTWKNIGIFHRRGDQPAHWLAVPPNGRVRGWYREGLDLPVGEGRMRRLVNFFLVGIGYENDMKYYGMDRQGNLMYMGNQR